MTPLPPSQDIERLKVLAMLHYVVAGLVLALALLPLVFVAIGGVVLLAPESMTSGDSELPPLAAGLIFLAIGLALFVYGLVLAIALVVSGGCLRRHKHYWFSVVVACGALTFTPLGTVLGVATLAVLVQESVRELYGVASNCRP
ncbi:hypothetical protein IQ265_04910 [Nodosilinea sp. LEGE 06152]|uniref:hypothetical protein n=1 Tax=Nodosilinea sp. LEGE 06152 TaxID=2777966 RepID=UPI00187FE9F4|nr:hypothetical protein [Nodosilinea sp. LEGE 06152]MBE9156172.1 hypothetical protein [Nodosilinea sp. LEGE 06152]